MPTVHFLNVCQGDCSIIQHGSGRVTVIDISNGNAVPKTLSEMIQAVTSRGTSSTATVDFRMREWPTNPIAYLKKIGISNVFRFILTHPDMDHMDGIKALFDKIGVSNFWDGGLRREKPDFSDGNGRFKEEDWNKYEAILAGRCDALTVVQARAAQVFQFANQGDPEARGDCWDIVAPTPELVSIANKSEDPNDGSYVLVYRTYGGKIIFAGDSHDKTWEYILEKHADKVKDCSILIAPHHGRDSSRSYEFLDVLNPRLTLFGCADSEDLGYAAWNQRELPLITNNQAGNVLLDATDAGIDIYVENKAFGETWQAFDSTKTLNGCFFIGKVASPEIIRKVAPAV